MILKQLHPWVSLRCILLNWNTFHPLKLGSGVHQRSWMGKHLWRFYQVMMMWAETKQQHLDPPVHFDYSPCATQMSLQSFPLSCHKAMDLLRSHPCVSKLICLTFNHIPVLECRPSPAHPIFLSRDWQSSSSSILFFWAFIFLFGLQRVAAPIFGGVFPLQSWSLTAVKQWGQLVVSCLNGKEISPGGQGLWPYSDLHVLSLFSSFWSRTRVCHMSSCRKQQSSLRILAWNSGYVAGIFKCSAVWLMVTSLLWNLKWTITERGFKIITFKRNFLG